MALTKKELQEYHWACRNIQRLEERLLEIETAATKRTTTLTQDPMGGGYKPDRLANLVVQMVDIQKEINGQLGKLYETLRDIEKNINTLPEREKYLIRARYIDGLAWEQICVDMGYSWRQTHRLHARALKLLA